MAQEGDDSPMMLMCELVNEDDPVPQAMAKETDTLVEEKVCLHDQVSNNHTDATGMKAYMVPEVHEHTDATGMKAYMAPEVHDVRRSVASQGKEVKAYVAPEVHGVQHGVTSQGNVRRIVASWGKPAIAEERSSVLGDGSESSATGSRGQSKKGVGASACSGVLARGENQSSVPSNPGSQNSGRPSRAEGSAHGSSEADDHGLEGKGAAEGAEGSSSTSPPIVQEERTNTEEPEKFEDTDTMEYSRQAPSLAEER